MAKTVGTRMVESMLGTLMGSMVDGASAANPMPRCAPDGEPITPRTMANRIDEEVEKDPRTAMQLCLLLACLIARQQKVSEKDALMAAAAAWAQTAQLT